MKTNRIQMIALLSASTVIVSWGIMNVNLPNMAAQFASMPLALVENLATLSSLFIMIAVLSSHRIALVLGYKKTVLTGLALVGISGVLPLVVTNFYVIFAARALLGFGIGMFQSLLVTFNKYFYHGEARTRMFGFQSACEGLGGMTFTLLAGQLVKLGWQGIFYAYFLLIPIFLMFALFVPKLDPDQVAAQNTLEATATANSAANDHVQASFASGLIDVFLVFGLATLFMILGIKVGPLIIFKGYGTATDGATVLLMLGFGAMLAGLSFVKVTGWLKSFTLPFMYLVMAGAIFMVGAATNIVVATLGGVLTGFSFRTIVPYLLNHINSGIFAKSELITALFLVALNLGFFLSPYAALVLGWFNWDGHPQTIYYLIAMILMVLALVAFGAKMVGTKKGLPGQD